MIRRLILFLCLLILLSNCKNKEAPVKEASSNKVLNLPKIQNNIGALRDLFLPYGDGIDRLKYLMSTSELFLIQYINNPDGLTERALLHQIMKTDYPQCVNAINATREIFADDSKTKMGAILSKCDTLIEKERKIMNLFYILDREKNASAIADVKVSVQSEGEINRLVKKIELDLDDVSFFISLQRIACIREIKEEIK